MNSPAKGKRVERAACAYLRSLGFDAQRGARNGVKGGKDIMSVELSGVRLSEDELTMQLTDPLTATLWTVMNLPTDHERAGACVEYATRLIRYKARQLSRQPGFSLDERCDLEHDLLTDLIDRLPKFDPAKAQLNTFVARVVERRVATLIRCRFAEMRSPEREECSLDDTALDCDGRAVPRHQLIAESSSVPQRLRGSERNVAEVLARLSELHRAIALGLVTGTVNSIANELGIPRSAVERHIDEIREVFEDAGLCEYL